MKPLNILIVDDSAMMRQFVRRAVQLSEVPVGEVHEAANGKEALAVMDARRGRRALHRHQHAGDVRTRAAARARASGSPTPARIVVSTDGSEARRREMQGLARW